MNSFINAIIRKLDEEAFRFLKPHENKIVCFDITHFTVVYFQIKPEGLEHIQFAQGQHVDTTFKGTLPSFMKMIFSKQAIHNDLHIKGDLDCAKALYDTWRYLDCDWEGAFATVSNPTLAHGLFQGLRKSHEWVKETYEARTHDFSTYLQDEVRLLPTQHEMEAFFKAIEQCRDDVDRLEAKINLFIKGRS